MFAALELLRHVLERLDVGGDVFAFGAVTPGRAGDKLAVLVAQRHRQAVDLRLGRKHDLFGLRQTQETADATNKIGHILFGKGIVERQHRDRMPYLGKARRRRRADPRAQGVAGGELRKTRFDRGIATAQFVILGVADGRRVVLIVAAIMAGDFVAEPRMLGLRLSFGQRFNGRR